MNFIYLILRRKNRLNHEQSETIAEFMRQNDTLYRAYLLKEQINDILDDDDIITALERFEDWKSNVERSNICQFKRVLRTIVGYFYGIRNYFKYRVTNAASEGFNNKINVIKRKAYGYWDLNYFILKIFQACGVCKSSS